MRRPEADAVRALLVGELNHIEEVELDNEIG